jgi:hypothetical protein
MNLGYSSKTLTNLSRAFRRPPSGRSAKLSYMMISYMMTPKKTNPRAEYRLRETQRVNESISLAHKFPKLKALKVDLTYFEPDGLTRTGEVRYSVNVDHAKSVFSFVCQNAECLGGDFDLSDAVAEAVAKRRRAVEGEIRCQGTRVKPKEDKSPCHKLLRYKLTLGYV